MIAWNGPPAGPPEPPVSTGLAVLALGIVVIIGAFILTLAANQYP